MITRNLILPQTYNDSIVLMQYTVELEAMPGVNKAAIMMATPATLQFLQENSLLVLDKRGLSSDDMILAASGRESKSIDQALETISQKIQGNVQQHGDVLQRSPDKRDADDAILWREVPSQVNLALISVPGQYATAEAWQAFKSNRHVMIFSNNVSLEDEIALKKAAQERNLLMMGPDCGTAILNGIPLGFANHIQAGDIGIVAAAGSGLQALTCLIDSFGGGITQALGTGGRDLKTEVNGITTRMALKMLAADEKTKVIVILSKPPDVDIAKLILSDARKIAKPVVMCMLGIHWQNQINGNVHFESTIHSAANTAVQLSKGTIVSKEIAILDGYPTKPVRLKGLIRCFYSGGTLAYEAYLLLQQALGEVYSNIAMEEKFRIGIDQLAANHHIILDMGTEEFTMGRPHPMIDGRWRSDLISQAGHQKDVRIVLLDIILGYGADENPVGSIIKSIRVAQEIAKKENRKLTFIAFIVGTEKDPQGYSHQREILQDAGVLIADQNEMAVQMAVRHLADDSK